MTTELTEKPTTAPEKPGEHGHDAAPSPLHSRTMGTPDMAMPQELVRLEPVKRAKTNGEVVFNIGTYGGFALVGNEVTSKKIIASVTDGRYKEAFAKFSNFFTKHEHAPDYIKKGRMPFLLVATIGGMLMVPPILIAEHFKPSIVRGINRMFYGKQSDQDPHFVEAYQALDNAPPQTLSSLIKGRIVTVLSALGADWAFGWEHGVTSRLSSNPTYQKFSSLDKVSNTFANWAVEKFNVAPEKRLERIKSLESYTWLFTLSTTLTGLFYISSKIFATRQEKKQQQRVDSFHRMIGDQADEAPELRTAKVPALLTQGDTPGTQISAIERAPMMQPHGLQIN